VAWENVNKVDIFDRRTTLEQSPNELVLQDTTNQNMSSSSTPLSKKKKKKKKERGFSVFLAPNFTENECNVYIKPLKDKKFQSKIIIQFYLSSKMQGRASCC
jgi:hypothetical protein